MSALKRLIPILAYSLLIACGQTPLRDQSLPLDQHLAQLGYRQGEPLREVLIFNINGWEYLDKSHMALRTGPSRAVLVEFTRPCRNLAFSNTIGYSSINGSLSKRDKVVSGDGSGFIEHCLIEEIYRLEKVEKPSAK